MKKLLNWVEVCDNLIACTKETIAPIEGASQLKEFKENLNKAMSSTQQIISTEIACGKFYLYGLIIFLFINNFRVSSNFIN